MEQQSGASGAAQAQAARTILPGEPFDPPAASQVPAPREEIAAPEAPMAPPAWNYPPPAPPEGAALYQSFPAPQTEPQAVSGDFDTLHEFASLPVAPQYEAPQYEAPQFAPPQYEAPQYEAPRYDSPQFAVPAPAPETFSPPTEAFAPAAFPPPPAETQAVFAPAQPEPSFPPPVFAPAEDALPPLPPPQGDEGMLAGPEPEKKSKDRKPVDKRLLAGALVVVLAGGGYFGYTQLSKKSNNSNANAPVAPVTAPVAHYDFPSNVAGLPLQSAASSAQLRSTVEASVKAFSPTLAKTFSFASYSAGQPSIITLAFHPAAPQLATDYAALVRYSSTPDAGNTAVASHAAAAGAAGGVMTCGGMSGAHPYSWCVWRGASTVGVMQISGSPKSQITEILTREMRAYAEH